MSIVARLSEIVGTQAVLAGGEMAPRQGARMSVVPISASAITGKPAAIASSNTSPCVSVREAKTKASAAA